MQTKNFYDILEIPKEASADDIKKAYRSLAMRYHPDRNKEHGAEERFKEINEAYDTLSDPYKKERYDTDSNFKVDGLFESAFVTPRWRGGSIPIKGSNIFIELTVSLKETQSGSTREISCKRTNICKECDGKGIKYGKQKVACPVCSGSGSVFKNYRNGNFHVQQAIRCTNCNGQGKHIAAEDRCESCKGDGTVISDFTFSLNIPAGITHNGMIGLSEQGNVGRFGGPKGDIIVAIKVPSDPTFSRVNNDLHIKAPVSLVDACLGTLLDITLLDESTVQIEVPECCPPGKQVTVKGKGFKNITSGETGDAIISLLFEMPKEFTPKQKEILAQLKETFHDEENHQDKQQEESGSAEPGKA